MPYLTDDLIKCLATVIEGSTDGFRNLNTLTGENAGLARSLIEATSYGLSNATQDTYTTNFEITQSVIDVYRAWTTNRSQAHSALRRYLANALETERDHWVFARTDHPELLLGVVPIGIAFSGDPGRAFDLAHSFITAIEDDIDAAVSAGAIAMICAHRASGMAWMPTINATVAFLAELDGDDLVGLNLGNMIETLDFDDYTPPTSAGGLVAAAVRQALVNCG